MTRSSAKRGKGSSGKPEVRKKPALQPQHVEVPEALPLLLSMPDAFMAQLVRHDVLGPAGRLALLCTCTAGQATVLKHAGRITLTLPPAVTAIARSTRRAKQTASHVAPFSCLARIKAHAAVVAPTATTRLTLAIRPSTGLRKVLMTSNAVPWGEDEALPPALANLVDHVSIERVATDSLLPSWLARLPSLNRVTLEDIVISHAANGVGGSGRDLVPCLTELIMECVEVERPHMGRCCKELSGLGAQLRVLQCRGFMLRGLFNTLFSEGAPVLRVLHANSGLMDALHTSAVIFEREMLTRGQGAPVLRVLCANSGLMDALHTSSVLLPAVEEADLSAGMMGSKAVALLARAPQLTMLAVGSLYGGTQQDMAALATSQLRRITTREPYLSDVAAMMPLLASGVLRLRAPLNPWGVRADELPTLLPVLSDAANLRVLAASFQVPDWASGAADQAGQELGFLHLQAPWEIDRHIQQVAAGMLAGLPSVRVVVHAPMWRAHSLGPLLAALAPGLYEVVLDFSVSSSREVEAAAKTVCYVFGLAARIKRVRLPHRPATLTDAWAAQAGLVVSSAWGGEAVVVTRLEPPQ